MSAMGGQRTFCPNTGRLRPPCRFRGRRACGKGSSGQSEAAGDFGHSAAIMADGEADDVGFDILEHAQMAVAGEQSDPGGPAIASSLRASLSVGAKSVRRPEKRDWTAMCGKCSAVSDFHRIAARRGTARRRAGGRCPASRSASAQRARHCRSTAALGRSGPTGGRASAAPARGCRRCGRAAAARTRSWRRCVRPDRRGNLREAAGCWSR